MPLEWTSLRPLILREVGIRDTLRYFYKDRCVMNDRHYFVYFCHDHYKLIAHRNGFITKSYESNNLKELREILEGLR